MSEINVDHTFHMLTLHIPNNFTSTQNHNKIINEKFYVLFLY